MSKSPNNKVAVVIAAGGSGTRFSTDENASPKQFLNLRGRPLYTWSLLICAKHELVENIVIVTPVTMVEQLRADLAKLITEHSLSARIEVTAGGASRQDSVFAGLKLLNRSSLKPDHVLIHDAARPFLDFATLDRVIDTVIKYGACTVGRQVTDTIKRVRDSAVVETLPRQDLVAVQTPQGGRLSDLLQAHEEALAAGFATTDDASLLEWSGKKVFVVDGPVNNLKITDPLDLILAEALAGYLLGDRL
jgi:2-C-methyl-D-erythritol 4-phosphate cytidylyltransferase